MHFATQAYATNNNQALLERIGVQNQSLETLIEILEKYNIDTANSDILILLKDLQASFQKVTIAHVYVAPTTYSEQKLTVFNNETVVMISDHVLEEITEKIKTLRNTVIQ